MQDQKRVAAIHDISGFGKCSLTVALPIISAAGIETSVIPTAVLSTHTGGFTDFTYRDLTEDMRPFMDHWKKLGLEFDGIYTGYLGSADQIQIVSDFFDEFGNENNTILVDPVMADYGKLYPLFDETIVTGMKKLCAKADIIVPNLTEAAFILDEPYNPGNYTKEYIEHILRGLSELGPKSIVLTGVYFDNKELGAAALDTKTGVISYAMNEHVPGNYHGTGDVFGSALISAIVKGFTLNESIQIAVDFVHRSVKRTYLAATDWRFGVNFEAELGFFSQLIIDN
jgi:pyridoxine kinase